MFVCANIRGVNGTTEHIFTSRFIACRKKDEDTEFNMLSVRASGSSWFDRTRTVHLCCLTVECEYIYMVSVMRLWIIPHDGIHVPTHEYSAVITT